MDPEAKQVNLDYTSGSDKCLTIVNEYLSYLDLIRLMLNHPIIPFIRKDAVNSPLQRILIQLVQK